MPRKPQQLRAVATREAIIEAGFLCVAQLGFEGCTTRHIAEKAGVSIGSLYEYFANKELVYEALRQRLVDDVVLLVKQQTPAVTSLDIEAGVALLLNEFSLLLQQNNGRYLYIIKQLLQSDLSGHLDAINKVLMEVVVQYLIKNPQLAGVRDIPVISYIFINGGVFALLRLLSSETPPFALQALINGLARLAGQYVETELQAQTH